MSTLGCNEAEENVNFVVNNARLEHMHLTEDEIERIREVALGKKNSEQALKEIIALNEKKYGKK